MKGGVHQYKMVWLFTLLFGVTTGLVTSAVLAAKPRIESKITVESKEQLTASEKASLSRAAGRILLHVDDARKALQGDQTEDALTHIEKGLILVRIIEESSPDYEVKATITSGALTYEDIRKHRQLFVPVYEELDEISSLGPVIAAKNEQAKQDKSAIPVVEDVRIRYTRAELNVALAKVGLEQAKKALKSENTEKADDALAAIQTGVTLNYAEIDLPLEEARKNLLLAQGMIEHNQAKEARAALEEASEDLKQYEKSIGELRGEKVKHLRQEIRDVMSTIENTQKEKKGSNSLKEQIEGWWNSVTEWLS
ncbi:MAG TPA: YfdX family protein [Nitrospirales bacterium]|nr:YfdX family protein [Nitrospirales bacterium]